MNFKALRNEELHIALKCAVAEVREHTVDGIALLAEFAARDLHLKAGFASLFKYCQGELKFSNGMAWRWSKAARAVLSCPGLLDRLRDGRVSVCVAATLAHFPDLLARADGLTKEGAEGLLATVLPPRKMRRDIVPSHPRAPVATPLVVAPTGDLLLEEEIVDVSALPLATTATVKAAATTEPAGTQPPAPRLPMSESDAPAPTAAGRLHFDVSPGALAKLERARELFFGKNLGAIFEQALDVLLEAKDPLRRHLRRQKCATAAAGKAKGAAGSRRPTPAAEKARPTAKAPPMTPEVIEGADVTLVAEDEPRQEKQQSPEKTPGLEQTQSLENQPLLAEAPRLALRPHLGRATRDEATVRAEARCEFVSREGQRCLERSRCEHDHVRPLALGGSNALGNIRIICHAHHELLTRETFPGWSPRVGARKVHGDAATAETVP